MKKLLKYFIGGFIVCCVAFVLCLNFSGFQRACILGALRCNFNEVVLDDYQGGSKYIQIGHLFCQKDNQTLRLKDVRLSWSPMKLLLQRCLYIESLTGHVDVCVSDLNCTTERKCGAGFAFKNNGANHYGFLQQLQLPIKFHIASLELGVVAKLADVTVTNGQIAIKNLKPNNTGSFYCFADVDACLKGEHYKFQTGVNAAIQQSEKGIVRGLQWSGNLNLKGNYPKITFNGMVNAVTSSHENLKLDVHCGQANDFSLVGEYLKNSDKIYDFKWQGIFDHSLLNLLNIKSRPILSVLTEGNGALMRKDLVWRTHAYMSAWGKQFDAVHPTLRSLPKLSLKIQLDADISRDQLKFRQYNLILKEKGASRLFLNLSSLYPLVYSYKNGIVAPKKEESQLFEVNFYETPFEMFNPLLKPYGYQLQGNIKSGSVNVEWDNAGKLWSIATFQPLYACVKQLKRDDVECAKAINLRWDGKCKVDNTVTQVQCDANFVATDAKHTPFFKVTPKLKWKLGAGLLTGEGSLFFDNTWARGALNLESWGIKLAQTLKVSLDYNFEFSPKSFALRKLDLFLSSTDQTDAVFTAKLLQPLTGLTKPFEDVRKGDILSVKAKHFPLDFAQYGDVKFSGFLDTDLLLKKESDRIKLESHTPLTLEDFKLAVRDENMLDIKSGVVDCNAEILANNTWTYDVEKIHLLGEEGQRPILAGNVKLSGQNCVVNKSEGRLEASLDALCSQPIALSYPGGVGDVSTHWNIVNERVDANARVRCKFLETPFTLDLQTSCTPKEDQQSLKMSVELTGQNQNSDLKFDGLLSKDWMLSGKLISSQIFTTDIAGFVGYCQGVYEKFVPQAMPQKEKNSVVEEKSKSSEKPMQKMDEVKVAHGRSEKALHGHLDIDMKSIYADNAFLKNVSGKLEVAKNHIELKPFSGQLCDGNLQMQVSYAQESKCLKTSGHLAGVNLNHLMGIPKSFNKSLDSLGKFFGTLDAKFQVSANMNDWSSLKGSLDAVCVNGCYKYFNPSNKASQALGGLTTSLGLLLGGNISGMSSVGFLTAYFQSVPYDKVTCSLTKKSDYQVNYAASLLNPDLAVYANGVVGSQDLLPWAQQPLHCELRFGASATSPFSNYFNFDKNKKDSAGYYEGPACSIGGTLGKPDYSALIDLLVARSRKTTNESPAKEPALKQLIDRIF